MSCVWRVIAFCFAVGSFAAEPTTVFLLRHAERSPGEGDVSISDAGAKRAAELARVLGDARVQAIYVSALKRTHQTAQPLAAKLGLSLARINDPAEIVAGIRKKHAGKTVVVVHHSNTLPDVAKAFGLAAGSVSVSENEFDALFIVTGTAAGASVVKLRYGPPCCNVAEAR